MQRAVDSVISFEPQTVGEAAALLRAADAERPIVFHGGGTHATGTPPVRHVRLSTRGLRRVLEYAPEDLTITVEAGVTVADLGAVLVEHGQRVVLDVADPQRATVGGALAANAWGPRRLRFGSPRDLILGVSLLRADGVAARAGGKVVKNVAGFDLAKLMVGSHGTLALITAATLRVHPLPRVARAMRVSGLTAADVWNVVIALRARQLEPTAVIATRSAQSETESGAASRTTFAAYVVDVLFEGFEAGVTAQCAALGALAGSGRQVVEVAPETMRADDARIRGGGPLRVRCTAAAADFANVDEIVADSVLRTLHDGACANAYPTLGTLTIAGSPTSGTADALRAARDAIESRGGTFVVEVQPSPADDWPHIEPWGTPPPSFALMREIKARFDPHGRLCPGRFIGGL